jgi:hypothetical protein
MKETNTVSETLRLKTLKTIINARNIAMFITTSLFSAGKKGREERTTNLSK